MITLADVAEFLMTCTDAETRFLNRVIELREISNKRSHVSATQTSKESKRRTKRSCDDPKFGARWEDDALEEMHTEWSASGWDIRQAKAYAKRFGRDTRSVRNQYDKWRVERLRRLKNAIR